MVHFIQPACEFPPCYAYNTDNCSPVPPQTTTIINKMPPCLFSECVYICMCVCVFRSGAYWIFIIFCFVVREKNRMSRRMSVVEQYCVIHLANKFHLKYNTNEQFAQWFDSRPNAWISVSSFVGAFDTSAQHCQLIADRVRKHRLNISR